MLKVFLPALLCFFMACSGVKLSQKVEISSGDWIMSGGSPEQKNIAFNELAPPLYKLWDYNLEAGVGNNGIAVADAVVFVNNLAGEMISIDVATGGKIGTLGFLGKDASSTPLLLGDNVILTFAGDDKYSVVSYDLTEAERRWRKNFGYIQTSPVLKNNAVYFASVSGNQYKINDSGRLIWKYAANEPVHSTCAVSDSFLTFGTDKGSLICLSTETGFEIWKIKINAPVFSTPLIDNNRIYFGADDSVFYSINADNGSFIWRNNLKTKLTGGCTLFNDSMLVFGGINGNVYALNKNTGDLVWSFLTYGTITSTPVSSGKYIYVTSFDSRLYCLEGSSGVKLWDNLLENKSRTTPVIWRDYLFVAADRSLICFTDRKFERTK